MDFLILYSLQGLHVIDNIFSNNIQNDIIAGNLLFSFSDHFAQFVSIKRQKVDYKDINIFQRDYSSFSTDSFRDDISIQNWKLQNDANDAYNDFYFRLKGAVDRHAPIRKLTPKEVKTKNKPWITPDILKLIKEREKARARKIKQPNSDHWKLKYNVLRNEVN